MDAQFPYLKISKPLTSVIGTRDAKTRVFRNSGSPMMFRAWLRDLQDELRGDLIPATWVPEFVEVTRAAVHKRIKAGKLTMFVFELHVGELDLRLRPVSRHKKDVSYCVMSECQAWHEEIVWREARKGPPELLD